MKAVLIAHAIEAGIAYVALAGWCAWEVWSWHHRTTPPPERHWYRYLWAPVWPVAWVWTRWEERRRRRCSR